MTRNSNNRKRSNGELASFVGEFFGSRGNRFSKYDIDLALDANGFDSSRSTASTYLSFAVDLGIIKRVRRGEYVTIRSAARSPSFTGGHRG